MTISKDLLDDLLNGFENTDELLGERGLIPELKVQLMERMFGAELIVHFGYEPDEEPSGQQMNRRKLHTQSFGYSQANS